MVATFKTRYQAMGLQNINDIAFYYNDKYGAVLYRYLQAPLISAGNEEVSLEQLPALGVWTKPVGQNRYRLIGIVSDRYKFVGHDIINNSIRTSVESSGNAILDEKSSFSFGISKMYNQMIIRHGQTIPQVGDVYPQVIVRNTYDGTGAQVVDFGICLQERLGAWIGIGLRKTLGTIAQIHIANATARMTAEVGSFVNMFAENVGELIRVNFSRSVSETEMLSVLELVEQVGKRKRDKISELIKEITGENNEAITSWNLFLAITKFCAIEKNLNSKVLLEDIAERCLTIPAQMMDALETMRTQTRNVA
jgi:hypothetical protein